MAALSIFFTGSEDDLEFLRSRIVGACEELVEQLEETYENNLDGHVEVSWEFET
jgi:hypothetical protein